MEKQGFNFNDDNTTMQEHHINENTYELQPSYRKEEYRSLQQALHEIVMETKQKQSKLLLLMTLFHCLALVLLLVLVGIAVWILYNTYPVKSAVGSAACAASSNHSMTWIDGIAESIYEKLSSSLTISNSTHKHPDCSEWAILVTQNMMQLLQSYPNLTEPIEMIQQTTRDSIEKLINIVNTLSNLQDTSTSTAGVVNDVLILVRKVLVLHNESMILFTSCKEIKENQPNSPSGVYTLTSDNKTYLAYCNMEELCGSAGGWTRLAYLDMSDATQNCPNGFRIYQEHVGSVHIKACGRPVVTNSGSCQSVQFPSNGISYSQVCGRVVGYSFANPDAIDSQIGSNHNNIDADYVDGVSITHGSPHQHVWTLMAANAETFVSGGEENCPCVSGSSQVPQSFVGNHYYCEGSGSWNDPLWDGKGCPSDEISCCSVPGIPWFHRDYGNITTTDYLELRVCADEDTAHEDSPVSMYEIYVK